MVFRELSLPVRLLFYLFLARRCRQHSLSPDVDVLHLSKDQRGGHVFSLRPADPHLFRKHRRSLADRELRPSLCQQHPDRGRLRHRHHFTISTTAAYGLARYHFSANRALFLYFLVGMAVPTQALMVPSFKLMAILDSWANGSPSTHPLAQQPSPRHPYLHELVLPSHNFHPRLFHFDSPRAREDAARVDGARELQILRLVMVPLAMPAIATMTIFYFVFFWNDFLWPLIYLHKHTLRTIPLGIMHFEGKYVSLWSLQVAALSLAAWPPIS